jgi:hypothetical protein
MLEDLARRLLGGEFLKLPRVGHIRNIEASEAFTAAFVRFIGENRPRW